jgi:ribulose-phosphate 3-epimerase
MSVNPGFGGQSFIDSVLPKASRLKTLIDSINRSCLIEVDGGVSDKNIKLLKQVGVDVVVAGSYVFNHKNKKEAIESLQI